MGFWKTFFQVCSGTEVFLRLLDCRLGKAFLHLFLLSFLLALMLAWGHSALQTPKIRMICQSLFQEIGSLRFESGKGIRTGKNAEKKQSYLLDDRLRFDYYPGSTLTESDLKNWNTPFGVAVMDNGIVFWAENYADSGKGKYLAAPLLGERNPMRTETIQTGISAAQLYAYLKANLEHKEGRKIDFMLPEAKAEPVAEYLITCVGIMVFFGALLSQLLLVAGVVLFFAVMQYFWFAAVERRPTFRQILVILIYIAFPALLIASLYTFILIPSVSPQTVFFVVYFVYYMIVFRRIRLTLNPPGGPEIDDF